MMESFCKVANTAGIALLALGVLFIVINAGIKRRMDRKKGISVALIAVLMCAGAGCLVTSGVAGAAYRALLPVEQAEYISPDRVRECMQAYSLTVEENTDEAEAAGADCFFMATDPMGIMEADFYGFSDVQKAETEFEFERQFIDGCDDIDRMSVLGIEILGAMDGDVSRVVAKKGNSVMVLGSEDTYPAFLEVRAMQMYMIAILTGMLSGDGAV